MKTDFTATGKRTWKGSLKDGYNGVKRYFLGNFYDSKDQVNIFYNKGFYWFWTGKTKAKKKPKIEDSPFFVQHSLFARHCSINIVYLRWSLFPLLSVIKLTLGINLSMEVNFYRKVTGISNWA